MVTPWLWLLLLLWRCGHGYGSVQRSRLAGLWKFSFDTHLSNKQTKLRQPTKLSFGKPQS
eukprot:4153538-Alexandrium_andersonii.AAC.1